MEGGGLRAQGSGFRVQGRGLRVQGSGFRAEGSGFRVQGSGFRVELETGRGGTNPRKSAGWTQQHQPAPNSALAKVYEFISQNVFIELFKEVKSPTKSSAYSLLSLIEILS